MARKGSAKRGELFVVKLSGSLFFSEKFEEFVRAMKHIVSSKRSLRFVLVAGGGASARRYIDVAQKIGADKASMDEIGIEVSRINATVLVSALGDCAYPLVPKTLDEVVQAVDFFSDEQRIVVLGGLHPGQSTNAVGALVAEKLRARRFYNATDVDGVYTEDPNKSKDARKLSRVTTGELSRILGGESMVPGGYDLMDPIALRLIERSRIPTTILRCDPRILSDAILKGAKHGTEVTSR